MSKQQQRWVISDTHFFHKNIIGHSARPFTTVEEMNREMIERWNTRVGKDDIVFHLGDVAMWGASQQNIVRQLQGKKRLILGNHDTHPAVVYMGAGFEKVLASYEGQGYVLTHIPVHPSQLGRFGVNIHGHTHQELVGDVVEGVFQPDRRYRNVCVEQIAYQPVLLANILERGESETL